MCECKSTGDGNNLLLAALAEQQRAQMNVFNPSLWPVLGALGGGSFAQQVFASAPPWAPRSRATEIPYNFHLER